MFVTRACYYRLTLFYHVIANSKYIQSTYKSSSLRVFAPDCRSCFSFLLRFTSSLGMLVGQASQQRLRSVFIGGRLASYKERPSPVPVGVSKRACRQANKYSTRQSGSGKVQSRITCSHRYEEYYKGEFHIHCIILIAQTNRKKLYSSRNNIKQSS